LLSKNYGPGEEKRDARCCWYDKDLTSTVGERGRKQLSSPIFEILHMMIKNRHDKGKKFEWENINIIDPHNFYW